MTKWTYLLFPLAIACLYIDSLDSGKAIGQMGPEIYIIWISWLLTGAFAIVNFLRYRKQEKSSRNKLTLSLVIIGFVSFASFLFFYHVTVFAILAGFVFPFLTLLDHLIRSQSNK